LDRFAESLEVGVDQRGERDQQRVVDAGEVDEFLPEMVERAVRQTGEVGDGVPGELGDVSAGEMVFGGAAGLAAERLVLRPEPHGQGWLRPGPGTRASCRSADGERRIRAGQNRSFRPSGLI
jgi:hypothetical protein